uniref:23R-B04dslf02IB n=1 Tax=synthetic construct TaxID=32630 RepID=UPI003467EED0
MPLWQVFYLLNTCIKRTGDPTCKKLAKALRECLKKGDLKACNELADKAVKYINSLE